MFCHAIVHETARILNGYAVSIGKPWGMVIAFYTLQLEK